MSTMNPDGPSDKDLLLQALEMFVNEYDDDRDTWPDNMAEKLDFAHWAISETTGLSRRDYRRQRSA